MKTLILAVIPARGGSKGIPRKNLQEIKKRTLVSWAITTANSVSDISHSAVSTDSDEIAQESFRSGVTSVVKRPEMLSGDTVLDQPVLRHAMLEIESKSQIQFDFVIMLQPTSPIRKKEDIENAIRLIKEKKYDSIWSISQEELHHHPQKQLKIDENGLMDTFLGGKLQIRRQDLQNTYIRNGSFYIFTRDTVLNDNNLKGNSCFGYITRHKYINIDTIQELEILRKQASVLDGRLILEDE